MGYRFVEISTHYDGTYRRTPAVRSRDYLVASDRSDRGEVERQVHFLSDLLLERKLLLLCLSGDPEDEGVQEDLRYCEAAIREAAEDLTPNLKDLTA